MAEDDANNGWEMKQKPKLEEVHRRVKREKKNDILAKMKLRDKHGKVSKGRVAAAVGLTALGVVALNSFAQSM